MSVWTLWCGSCAPNTSTIVSNWFRVQWHQQSVTTTVEQGEQLLRTHREEALREAEGVTYEAGGFLNDCSNSYGKM